MQGDSRDAGCHLDPTAETTLGLDMHPGQGQLVDDQLEQVRVQSGPGAMRRRYAAWRSAFVA